MSQLKHWRLFGKLCLKSLASVCWLWMACTAGIAQAQVKKPAQKTATETNNTLPLPKHSKPDTIIYIDPKTGKPKAAPSKTPASKAVTRKPDTIIYIDNGKPRQAQTQITPRQIDTVIVIKNGKQKKEPQNKVAKTPVKVQEVPKYCQCMALTVKAPDTLRVDDYVNYSFILKNNCKDHLWVSSASFGFYVFNPDGTPVKVLRKLQYVKQFKYPDFVQVSPGEEYTFDFADDPFFQYDIRPYWQYRFTFVYRNTTHKYKGAPSRTYLCNEFMNKNITIADKPRLRR